MQCGLSVGKSSNDPKGFIVGDKNYPLITITIVFSMKKICTLLQQYSQFQPNVYTVETNIVI